ncbi:hypothetical protein BC831DRAFT_481831 [Entophlyctis helioformis]|nr:hypothetical protein BC831DRAFT_481831 [Entophlyctis helioformis]
MSKPNSASGKSQPKKTVVGFSPSATAGDETGGGSSQAKPYGGVQDIRPKSTNADSVVSSQLASDASALTPPIASLSTSAKAAAPIASSIKRNSITSLRVGSPSRQSFEDRLFSEEHQNKVKMHAQMGETIKEDESARSSIAQPPTPQKQQKQQGQQQQGQQQQQQGQGSKKNKQQQQQKPPKDGNSGPPAGAASGEPPRKQQKDMTKAERRALQEQQREEKRLREEAGLPKPKGGKGSGGGGGGGQQQHQQSGQQTAGQTQFQAGDGSLKPKAAEKHAAASKSQKLVPLFSHLPQYERENTIAAEAKVHDLVHPVVRSLGQHYSEFVISGGNARCMAMLLAFKKVIMDYSTPEGTSLQRNLTQHISKQVDFLNNMRSLCASMKTAIRQIKQDIASLSIDLPDADIYPRPYRLRDTVIVNTVIDAKKIKNGDVILTYGRSSVVIQLLLEAHAQGFDFRVIVVDGRPKLEGKTMLKILTQAGIKCTYVLSNALPFVVKEATKVIIGASAVLSNGAVMSRVGTAVVAMTAFDAKIPVIVLCGTLKFSDQVRLDSFVWNEIGNPDDLVDVSNRPLAERLPATVPLPDKTAGGAMGATKGWRDVDPLKLLNLHYDVTPAKFVTAVVCELGLILSTSVLSVLRDAQQSEFK